MIDLTDDQAIAAADSLAHAINDLCEGQPSYVVMTALAALVAMGIDGNAVNEEGALDDHVEFVRYWIKRRKESGALKKENEDA